MFPYQLKAIRKGKLSVVPIERMEKFFPRNKEDIIQDEPYNKDLLGGENEKWTYEF